MNSFRMLTLAVFAAVTLPRLAQRGMFVDGLTYASIARNLAEGRGSFWTPSYTATIYPQFHDHPPFGFWLQSVWFRVLGDHLWVERGYSLAAALGTALLIAWIWNRLHAPGSAPGAGGWGLEARGWKSARSSNAQTPDPSPFFASDLDWLPILLWIVVPVVSWAIVGNLLETSMSMLTTAAVAAAVGAAVAARPLASAGWGIISGFCVVAASLTKGPVGLFPLAAPIVFCLISGSRRAWASLTGQWGAVALCAIALISSDAPRASIAQYFDQQVLASIGGRREISAGSWTIVMQLVSGVLAPMILAGGLIIVASRRFVRPPRPQVARAGTMFVLGLAGTLPIIASVKQAGHYLVPAVPLYALAAASLFAPTVAAAAARFAARRLERFVTSVSALVLLAAVGVSYLPGQERDRTRLADLDVLAGVLPKGVTIGICPESNGDWGLHAWFERRFQVSLDATQGAGRAWFLATAPAQPGCPPVDCTPATEPGRQLVLMKCPRGR